MGLHLQEKMGTSSVHPAAVRSFALNVAAAAAQCYPKSQGPRSASLPEDTGFEPRIRPQCVNGRALVTKLAPLLMEKPPGNQIEHKLFGFFANQLHRHFF